MITAHRAYIRREDYEAFRRIIKLDMPDTYDKWLYFRFDDRSKAEGIRMTVKSVEINPSEFHAWCGGDRPQPTIDDLDDFAREKATGERYR
jgi:hypothetical protein